ncbi:BON domain-containing protein [Caldichromatium japonicum]|uniref:BON domain-containing protein n=1 Tax=Caldichromatium japonicum TaxID=2699430 RepID=UPI001FEC27A8|nr:BON domain-containing protein [Caldichromatium japonicum]
MRTAAEIFLYLVLSALTSGCAPLIVGGAAVAGAAVLHDRRLPQTILDDRQIELAAHKLLAEDAAFERGARIAIHSYNRTVLLTGQAESHQLAHRAADRISRLPKVERVIDEIRIGPLLSLARQAEDRALAARISLELAGIALPDFDPTRIKPVVADGVVYLLGLVTRQEAEQVAERTRHIPGVRTVILLFEEWIPHA